MTVAEELASFFVDYPASALPEVTTRHAAMVVASTLASAAQGIEIASTKVIRELALDRGGNPQAELWFTGERLPTAAAAQVNAVASDAAASDDTDLRNIVHAGTPATAAALAVAPALHRTGEELLAAIVLGYEAAGRISAAITPGFCLRGFHGSIGAVFAATISAGRLLGLTAPEMAEAIALTATSIGGITTAADTSTSREYHAGLAVWLGINAALVAQKGFHGKLEILECGAGFFESFGGTEGAVVAKAALAALDEDWGIVNDMAIKLVPGGHSSHSIGEAAALAATEGQIDPAEVATIAVSRPQMATLKGPKHPDDLISMAHSPSYFAAAGVADREFGWVHATPAKIADPEIHRLIDKVVFDPEPASSEPAERYRQGATVRITTLDGREVTRTVFVPKGAGARGIEWSDVDTKFRVLFPGGGLPSERTEAALAVIHELPSLAETSALAELLVP